MAAKILLVEDDNNLREIYEARLQAEGYTIVTAKDGEEALVVAKAELPNLVISDVMMPRISGFEMLDIMRNTDDLRDTKVIMLTALGQADDKTRASSLGADRYLVKSQVTLEDIVKSAHELIGDMPAAPEPPVAPPAPMPPTMPTPPQPTPPVMPSSQQPALAKTEPPAAVSSPAPAMPGMTPPPVLPQPVLGSMMNAATPNPAPMMPPLAPPPVLPQPMAMSAPPAMPSPAAAAQPDAAALVASPTEAQEQATIKAQIDNFVRTAAPTTEVVPSDPSSAASKATQDDAVLASAMNDLAASVTPQAAPAPVAPVTPPATSLAPMSRPVAPPAPMPPTMPTPPQPTPPVMPSSPPQPTVSIPTEPVTSLPSSGGSVRIANKKVIEPLNSSPKPALEELVAREEAKNVIAAAMPTGPLPPTTPSSTSLPQAGNVFSPPTGIQPPQPLSSADPNNIAL